MNKEQALQKIEELKAFIKAEEAADPFPRSKEWDSFEHVTSGNKVAHCEEHLTYGEVHLWEAGNYFPPGKGSLLAEYRQKTGQYLRMALLLADGYEFTPGGDNWYCFLTYHLDKYEPVRRVRACEITTVYLPTKEKAQQLADWANKMLREVK